MPNEAAGLGDRHMSAYHPGRTVGLVHDVDARRCVTNARARDSFVDGLKTSAVGLVV